MEVKGPFGEAVVFKKSFPKSLFKKSDHYFFIDSVFRKNDLFKNNKNILFVKAGERFKTILNFQKNLQFLQEKKASRKATLVAIGGGSVGDAIGFLASVYLRGVNLVHVPTTWLAAVDSSVGGKTALNLGLYKNQIGSFYPPNKVYFIKDLIESSESKNSEGEVLKTLLLNHNKKWAQNILESKKQRIEFNDLIHFFNYKKRIVQKDVKDEKKIRAVLNLGHTLGHVFELKLKISHSDAVKKGLKFALCWSFKKKLVKKDLIDQFEFLMNETLPVLSSEELRQFLLKDKKASGDRIDFIFISDQGPVVKAVSVDLIVKEYKRQQSL